MKYKPKNASIDAMQFDGTNFQDIAQWLEGLEVGSSDNFWISVGGTQPTTIWITTTAGTISGRINDYVFRDAQGNLGFRQKANFEAGHDVDNQS